MVVRALVAGVLGFTALSAQAGTGTGARMLQFKAPGRVLTFETLGDRLVHFDFSPPASAPAPGSPMVTTPFVYKKDFGGASRVDVSDSGHEFETPMARVQVDPDTLCFSVFDKTRQQMLTRICPTSHGLTLDQMRMQNVYGLGEQFQALGVANGDWIGKVRTPGGPYGNALTAFGGGAVGNAQFPILYALGPDSLNYALYLDTVYPLRWDFTHATWDVEKTREGSDPSLRGYFFLGEDLPALRESFMDLVGHPPVPPKKAFGLWVSEFGYRNWGEIKDKLSTLREHGFPVDGFVLDLYWYGGYQSNSPDSKMGILDWDTVNFPNPRQTVADLRNNEGIGLMTIEQSYVSQNLANFSSMAARGFLAKDDSVAGAPMIGSGWWGQGGMIDWTNPAAGHAWHDENRRKLTDIGVTFHWTDLGEPEMYSPTNYYDGGEGTGHLQADVHNAYDFLWNKSIDDGYKSNHETLRHFILSRSGAPGLQRLGSAMWSGDIGSNLRSLSSHLNAQMHLSLSGIDYFGADIGGFHREALEGDLNEVYTKWFAHATLFDVPVRPHTDDGSKKNNTAPDRIGDMKSNLFNLRQRYELAPYYYSLAYRAYLGGEPVIPPLVYYYQNDPSVRALADEKMIGPELLAATAAHLGETSRDVYLPAGDWVDYHTLAGYRSQGQWFKGFPLQNEDGVFRLPLFARAGAIIPKALVDGLTMNILGKRLDGSVNTDLIVRVFESSPAQEGTPTEFDLFEDDGVTEAYRGGAYARTKITQLRQDGAEIITIAPTVGTYAGAPSERRNRVELVADPNESQTVWRVLWNDRPIQFYDDPADLDAAWEGWSIDDRGVIQIKSDVTDVTDAKTFEVDFR